MWMNEWDIEEALHRLNTDETPNLYAGAVAVDALRRWTNRNSDGWHIWNKPSRAAASLQTLLHDADRYTPVDITDADLSKALRPVKSFLTRHGVDHTVILPAPAKAAA